MRKTLEIIAFVAAFIGQLQVVLADSRTAPPSGASVVQIGASSAPGVYNSIRAAVAAMPNDQSKQTLFIYPGVYSEQVTITRPGPLTVYGYTTDTSSFQANQVVIQARVGAIGSVSDDASGTLQVHKDDFQMYNVNVTNTYGPGNPAIALSQYGNRVGLYASSFIGYQDTVNAHQGTQVYLKCYIEGAIDFIFGVLGQAYFGGNTIGIKAAGPITASGRMSNDQGSYVFDHNTIVLAPDVDPNTPGMIFLGRPWGNFAKVIFKNTVINALLNQTVWSTWMPGDDHTDNVFLAEYNSAGSGIPAPNRPNWSKLLTASEADAFSVASAVGSDYKNWVDLGYFV